MHTSLLGLSVAGVLAGVVAELPTTTGWTASTSLWCMNSDGHELVLYKSSIQVRFSLSTENDPWTPSRRKIQRCSTPLQASIKPWWWDSSLSVHRKYQTTIIIIVIIFIIIIPYRDTILEGKSVRLFAHLLVITILGYASLAKVCLSVRGLEGFFFYLRQDIILN